MMLQETKFDFGRGEAICQYGGRGVQTLHFSAANGFPVAAYDHFLSALGQDYRVIGLENRGLWGAPPPSAFNWADHAEDLIAMLADRRHRGEDSEPVIAMGHSIGGTVTALAARHRPDLFKALILIDPACPPGKLLGPLPGPLRRRFLARHKLVTSTRDRVTHWAGPEEFRAALLTKGLYRRFCPDALNDYVRAGLTPADGGGYRLRYDRDWEAQNFLHTTAPWAALRSLSTPTLVLRAEQTYMYSASRFAALSRNFAESVECGEISGAGHMAIQEDPAQVLALVQTWLKNQQLYRHTAKNNANRDDIARKVSV